MTVAKEIQISDDFKAFDVTVKKCQEVDMPGDCKTSKIRNKIQEECNCVPYPILNFSNSDRKQVTSLSNQKECFMGILAKVLFK